MSISKGAPFRIRTLSMAARARAPRFDNFGNNVEIAESDVDVEHGATFRGTLESESPMVSYLRVAGITRTLWRNIPRRNSGVRYNRTGAGVQTFSQQFSKLEPSYPWYLILLKCRETSWRKKNARTDGRASERTSEHRIFITIFT